MVNSVLRFAAFARFRGIAGDGFGVGVALVTQPFLVNSIGNQVFIYGARAVFRQ